MNKPKTKITISMPASAAQKIMADPQAAMDYLTKNGFPCESISVHAPEKSWTQSVRDVVATLPDSFKLADVYQHEATLKTEHPENQNVRAKIRQQLQVLRDKKELTNPEPGKWSKVKA